VCQVFVVAAAMIGGGDDYAAESTTKAYAGTVALHLWRCAATGQDWRAAAGSRNAFLNGAAQIGLTTKLYVARTPLVQDIVSCDR
jgi:hypothetical protein